MSQGTGVGQKLRLNVLALEGESEAGKFLVCVDCDAGVGDLAAKIHSALQKNCIGGHPVRLLNGQRAELPSDECASDILRDGEAVIAILSKDPLNRPPWSARANRFEEGVDNTEQTDEVDKPEKLQGRPPGPSEIFEEDVQVKPLVSPGPPGDCWEIANLTPKLREFISMRFCEVASCNAQLEKNFIVVTMRPPGKAPLQYSLARVDVIEFERLCGRSVEAIRSRLGYFERAQGTLTTLLRAGSAPADYATNMLPYHYRAGEEFEDLLSEAHANADAFGQVEGFRPVILVDTSGAVGEMLPHIRLSLKRMLYSFLVAKSRFNLARTGSEGKTLLWERSPVPPTTQKLREAEEWFDRLKPLRKSSNLLGGLQTVLQQSEADMIYVISSGFSRRDHADYILNELRAANAQGVPINVVGIDCDDKGEHGLRELARQHGGTFRHKRFSGPDPDVFREKPQPEAPRVEDTRLSIGGQLDILDIVSREQEVQVTDWLEEQKCANRLLLMTVAQSAVPTPGQALDAHHREALGVRGEGPMRMQELIQGAAAGGPGRTSERARRGAAQPVQCGGSLPPPEYKRAAGAEARRAPREDTCRRPSVANPWDRPTATVRVSQLAGQAGRLPAGSAARVGSALRRGPA